MGTVTQGTYETLALGAQHRLTVTTPGGASGTLQSYPGSAGGPSSGAQSLTANSTVTVGPYNTFTRHRIDSTQGTITYTAELMDFPTTEDVETLIDAAEIGGGSVFKQQFSGNGVTVAFTLSAAATTAFVLIGGAAINFADYSVSGTTLTFTSAPESGTNNIKVLAW